MWSFGSKREDPVQVAPDKMPNASSSNYQQHHHYQQQRQQQQQQRQHQSLAIRRNSLPRADRQLQQSLSPKEGNLAARSRLFYKNKKLTSTGSKNYAKSPGRGEQNQLSHSKSFISRRYFGRGSKHNINSDDYLQGVSVDETSNGIEVSFPGNQSPETALRNNRNGTKGNPVISLKEQIWQRQRVYKSRFSTAVSLSSDDKPYAMDTKNWRPKGHRVPLLGIASADTAYADALQLLKNAPAVDERTAVQQELSMLETEISSLERDRIWLEQSINGRSNAGRDSSGLNKENDIRTWDTHQLLKDDAIKKQPLSLLKRNTLQKQRGNSLTIHLSNDRTHDRFVHNVCGKQHSARITSICKNDSSITTILPSINRSTESAATNLQHVGLLPTTDAAMHDHGIYFSRDVGQSQIIGKLSDRLDRRLRGQEGEGSAAQRLEVGNLMYLSTGSLGCYFAKFQSEECWWGSAVEDADFEYIMRSWDVYRVAFGPIETIAVKHSEQQPSSKNNSSNNYKALPTNSWIILSHDGGAVWKNLPSRLSNTLESRSPNSAAPAEVSLGPGDSYFVRFLDGSIDYSLPSKIARTCERIEERGGKITYVCLHPDISHDFIIRHTELTR
mmetsp:Transcript_762/g.1740  ORF Transcript_762/g.1740 Transcript_762/m.1740 type:complete len:614 (+) Transcript_762:69-1910(+)